ncbi:MAG TPA: alanyl-tRNA editing protein [Burkholderiaceae bacterium]|nr:alanyl-tRNA editing protein [Burkholderiaceae bacterium]
MTVRVFWEDPYAARLDARVTAVDGADVELDRTILFAFSGGQESDAGTIASRPVLQARLDSDRLIYTLPAGHGLKAGDRVDIEIDWARRYALMRLHFAAELVLELVCAALPGVEKIGAHIAADKARIDFAWRESIAPLLPALVGRVGELVRADLPIRSEFSDRAAGRRYWEVEGVARVPCGGTHLRRTGEVGAVVLKRRNVGQGKERVEIRLAP